MTPNEILAQKITRASIVKYDRLCNEAKSKIDFDAMKKELIDEVMKTLQSFSFYGVSGSRLDYTYINLSDIANRIMERTRNEVFGPIMKLVEDEEQELKDLLYSRPSEEDIQRILDYIKEGEVECSR